MTEFIEYKTLSFAQVADQQDILLTAEKTIFLTAVNVCNISQENIRIFLQIEKPLNVPIVKNYLISSLLIQPNESLNLLSDLEVFLQQHDILRCFSDGYTRKFDCTISYAILNESS